MTNLVLYRIMSKRVAGSKVLFFLEAFTQPTKKAPCVGRQGAVFGSLGRTANTCGARGEWAKKIKACYLGKVNLGSLTMAQIKALEFPFVNALPKREKSKWRKAWDYFQELSRITSEKGILVPLSFGAEVIGVSRQRVDELVDDGRIEVVEVHGKRFVTETSVIEYCRSERKVGRPTKADSMTKREAWKAAQRIVKDSGK